MHVTFTSASSKRAVFKKDRYSKYATRRFNGISLQVSVSESHIQPVNRGRGGLGYFVPSTGGYRDITSTINTPSQEKIEQSLCPRNILQPEQLYNSLGH